MTILRVLLASWAIVGLWLIWAVLHHAYTIHREKREREVGR
jgi:hypothetical protein